MIKFNVRFLTLVLAVLIAGSVNAQSSTYVVVTPASPVFSSNHVVGVSNDFAPGFPFGSFASDGIAKTDMYFRPESLFGREVTLGEIAGMSYWTKKGTTHAASSADWYLNLYTKRYAGQIGSSFYGIRIGTEPYFAENIADPANTWNNFSSTGPVNWLRFFESTYGYFGSYTDPHYSTFVLGTSLTGGRGAGRPYATQPILFFSPQTASGWASGFTGQIDGLSITLTDGSVANINFEDLDHTATKAGCKDGGWMTSYRSDFSLFTNQGDCVSYTNNGR